MDDHAEGRPSSTELNRSTSKDNLRKYKPAKSTKLPTRNSGESSRASRDSEGDRSESIGRRGRSRSENDSRTRKSKSSKSKRSKDKDKDRPPMTDINKSRSMKTKTASERARSPETQTFNNEYKKKEKIFSRKQVLMIVWFVWLLLGSCFYIAVLDLGIAEGFYMAVNIGYSIGWGDISETGHLGSQLFSTVYVLIGASFVGAALGIFAEHIVQDKDNWYEQEKENLIYAENMKDCNIFQKSWYFYVYHKDKLRSVIIWIAFVIVATFAAWNSNDEFGFGNALYFAVSSLSTGGHYSLPGDNRQWVYGLTGLYCAFGVPIMGIAMATIASFFINVGSIKDTLKMMKKPVSHEEIRMMTEFGLADEDGEIDKAEFIILCMVRTGAASPELIKLVDETNLIIATGMSSILRSIV